MSETPRYLPPEALEGWLRAAAEELDLNPDDVSIPLILDLARDVAHTVARPAAPLTTYLFGLAAGRASQDPSVAEDRAARLTALANTWAASGNAGNEDSARGDSLD